MALTPEQLRIQASAEGSGPPLTPEQEKLFHRMSIGGGYHAVNGPGNLEQSIPTYNPATGGMYDLQNPFDQLQNPFDQYGGSKLPIRPDGSIIQPPSLGPFDPNFVPSSPFDPVTSGGQEQIYSAGTGINTAALPYLNLDRPNPNFIPGTSPFDPVTSGGQESSTGTAPNTTNIFGAGNNPIMNNPIAPMPSPLTPPSGMNNNQDYSGLLKGIGEIFEQYFPNQGGGNNQFNQPGAQPTFDATGNSVSGGPTQSNQVFGNMITPDFGSY